MTDLTSQDSGKVGAELAQIIGHSIIRVQYLVSSCMPWIDDQRRPHLHEVDHGVEITLDNGTLISAFWMMEGFSEFLSVTTDPGKRLEIGQIETVDVSSSADWTPVIGHEIVGIGVANQISHESCPESVWAIRLDIDNQASVVIALGEIRDGVPAYLPDAVMVIFNTDDARTYINTSNTGRAWEIEVHQD